MRKKAVFLAQPSHSINDVYNSRMMHQLEKLVDIYPHRIGRENAALYAEELNDVEFAFSTWGMPAFSEEEIADYFPNLQALFYAAGTVQSFARPFLSRSVRVFSAWAANAVPVAEFTVAQILLANKGYFQAALTCKTDYSQAKKLSNALPGNYSAKVGILGAGMVGKKVIELLQSYHLDIYVFDPFLPDEQAERMNVHKCELTELFSCCHTISNHLANLPETAGILNKDHFDRMLPCATFINTGRGAQVVEADLIRALRDQPSRTALLDVTDPEPVARDSELLQLANVFLTPHIAGSQGRELERMAQYMLDEFVRYQEGKPLNYEVTLNMLETMA